MCYCSKDNYISAFSVSMVALPTNTESAFLVSLVSGIFLILAIYYIFTYHMKFPPNIVIWSLIVICLLTVIAINSPLFSFCFATFISCVLLFLSFPYEIYSGFRNKQESFFRQLLIFLSNISILDFLASVYILFFCVPKNVLIKRLTYIFLILIAYMITSRHLYYRRAILLESDLNSYYYLAYLMLFFGILTAYIRLFLNLSLFLTFATLRLQPSLLSPEILYVFGENDDSVPQKNLDSNKSGRPYFAFMDKSRNTYHQNFNPQIHSRFSRGSNFAIGFAGLAIGGATVYYAKMQAEAAIIQAQASKDQVQAQVDNNWEMARQNDLEEVSQGFMTREDFAKKYGRKI